MPDILGADRLGGLDRPIAAARGLPAGAYTSPALFELEWERLFRRTWVGAAVAHDVPEPGAAPPPTIAGEVVELERHGAERQEIVPHFQRHPIGALS